MKDEEIKNLLCKIYYLMIALVVIGALNTTLSILQISKNNNTTYTNTAGGSDEDDEIPEYDVSGLKEIGVSSLANETKSGTYVVYIGRASCGWCARFLPLIKEAQAEYKFTTLYIDIAKIINFSTGNIDDEDAYDTLVEFKASDDYKDYLKENFGTTPMVLIIKDGQLIDAQTGYVEYSTYTSFLEKNGIKK